MSQKIVDIVKGISLAAGKSYDGATDEEGVALKIGLKREEGNPNLDKRRIDNCVISFRNPIERCILTKIRE